MISLTKKMTVIFTALILTLSLLASFHEVSAQKRKKTSKKRTRTVTPPTPVQTQPTIVSEAEQYQNQNQQIITGETPIQTTETNDLTAIEAQPETFDEKLDKITRRLDELGSRTDGGKKNDYDTKQKRLALNLDILTKAEQRAESLRKQLFEVVEKENAMKTKLETLAFDLRPEIIDRQVAFVGTTRPEELREMRRKNLEAEKRSLESLLVELQTTRASLEANVQRADQLVEKLRLKLEKDIDEALNEEPKTEN